MPGGPRPPRTLQEHGECSTGLNVWAGFKIGMHKRDKALLEQIKSYFGVGNITKQGKDSIQYRVNSINDLTNAIIPHFDKYPLITKKRADLAHVPRDSQSN